MVNITNQQVITTPVYWYSATQAGIINLNPEGRKIGNIVVTFSDDCTVTTTNTEVILTNEIDKHYSGIQVSTKR